MGVFHIKAVGVQSHERRPYDGGCIVKAEHSCPCELMIWTQGEEEGVLPNLGKSPGEESREHNDAEDCLRNCMSWSWRISSSFLSRLLTDSAASIFGWLLRCAGCRGTCMHSRMHAGIAAAHTE